MGDRPSRADRALAEGSEVGARSARPELLEALHRVFDPEAPSQANVPVKGDQDLLLRAVQRQRLALVLAPVATSLPWPPAAVEALRQEARSQQRAALALIAATLEVSAALDAEGLRALCIKGPALALQTTGQSWSRGGGDIDVLVAPADLPRAVGVVEALGFAQPPGQFPRDFGSFWGRYCRWASHELPLWRQGRWLDLHWALNTVRAPLPPFEALWQARQVVTLNGRAVATLALEHAFRHSCLHAASDQWMELRHLVDITLLARQLPAAAAARLRRLPSVRHSCAAAYDATGCSALLAFTDPHRADCRRAIARARWAQERPPRVSADGAWHPGHWLATVVQQASLSSSPLDWLRVVARFSLLPAAFNDPLTGEDRGLMAMVQARRGRLRERMAERS